MGNRIIKESIRVSDSIDQLSWFEEVFFYRLITACDDYGCMDARPKLLASTLFPLKDIRTQAITDTLLKMSSLGMVTTYTVMGKPYLRMNAWDRCQRLRDSVHKYPMPDEADKIENTPVQQISISSQQVAAGCGELPQVAADSGLNPNPNPNTNTNIESENTPPSPSQGEDGCGTPAKRTRAQERFDEFWAAYPKKTGKGAAQKSFEKIKVTDDLLATMLHAIAQQKCTDQWSKDGGQFIPYPATWLNQRRWEDEVQSTQPKKTHSGEDFGRMLQETMNGLF